MGFFSGITSILGGATKAIGSILNPISFVGDLLGGVATNRSNRNVAQDQMAFQAAQSGTSWQRGVADMKAAGLSPMLAYSQGGASTPSGASLPMQNPVSPAVSSARSVQDISLKRAGVDQALSQTELNRAAAIKQAADAKLSTAQAANVQARTVLDTAAAPAARNAAAVENSWLGSSAAYWDRFMDSASRLNPFSTSVKNIKH